MDGPPYLFVDPRDIVSGAGAVFEGQHSYHRATNQPLLDPRPQAPSIPYNVPQPSPPRTTYAPLAHQFRPPPNGPRRPTSNINFNPTAPSFMPRRSLPQHLPPRQSFRTNAQRNIGQSIEHTPRTQQIPSIEISPVDRNSAVQRPIVATRPAEGEPSRSRRASLSTRPTAGVQRRRSSSAARRQAPYTTQISSPTAAQRSFPPPAMSNAQNIGIWLPGPYNVGDHSRLQTAPPPSFGQNRPSAPNPPAQSRPLHTPRSTARSTVSNSSPYYCTDETCHTPEKVYNTRSELTKHARIHRPMSERTHGCRAEGCMMRFWDPKDLRRHERKHTGERVQCTVCWNLLSRQDNLGRHMEMVHKDLVSPATPSIVTASSPSVVTASSPSLSIANSFAHTPRSDCYSPTIPSSPPSIGTTHFPSFEPRTVMPRHSSFNSGQGSPRSSRNRSGYSQAMEKSHSNDL